jgi:alpha-methylacyl-CoA racemase
MAQPLSGIVVVDFTTLLPGPLATLMLAEAGAEVIKIERPGGEDMRAMPPQWQGTSAMFAMLNASKRSVVLDLKEERDIAVLEPLLARADVLVEQFRPGVMDRLGLGFAALHARFPRLIYCSISGYGQSGPRAQEAGHDLNYIGNTGLLALSPGPLEAPVVPPGLMADIGGGAMPAVMNILLGLRQRDATGEGAHIDIAMSDAMFTFAWHAIAQAAVHGAAPGPGEARLCGGSPRYQLYSTSDGKFVACAALEQKFWQRFVAAIGLAPELANDMADPAATIAAVRRTIAARSAEDWRPIFAAADCCVTVVASLDEAMGDPHFVQRGLFERRVTTDGAQMMALPVPIDPVFREGSDAAKTIAPFGADNHLLSAPTAVHPASSVVPSR